MVENPHSDRISSRSKAPVRYLRRLHPCSIEKGHEYPFSFFVMKIIFLDIDGVLTLSSNGYRFDGQCLKNLKELIRRHDAKIIICSSWKEDTLKKTIRNLPAEIKESAIDQTPDLPGRSKGHEIQAWITLNTVDSYVILDDQPEEYLTYQKELHLVVTDPKTGLTREKCKEADWILKQTKSNKNHNRNA